MRMERSVIKAEVRSAGEGEDKRAVGLGIVYDKWEEIWPGYRERIRKGAVKNADTVKSYFNHNPNQVLSTLDSDPPLKLRETDKGLEYESPIPPTSYGKDLAVNLERRNVKGSSFSFSIPKGGSKAWEDDDGVFHRDISELILYEIGPVTDPAFVSTTASVRSAREAQVEEWRQAQEQETEPVSGDEGEPDAKDTAAAARRLIRHGELKASI